MQLRPLLAAAAVLAAGGASAQSLKPGLWEVNNRMQGAAGGQMNAQMAEMQKQMANLPPEQRKMMEEMMAKQGVRMAPGGGQGMAVQFCMSKEMAERHEVPADRGDCKYTNQQRSGNVMKVAFACTNPPATGEGQVTFTGSEGYNTKMTVKTTVNGKPETVDMEGSGKWLSANCGNLKPPGQR